ncbi:uncharacterized protein LOC132621853 [Lycium barbarum]|uniref:uncharacterized protein LOC132621853 n=1 Tax=Lycium barbarum TaxID=112863 RepID=UPI00293E9A4D|nr:uncharacterized protein LOC132621853 [Lycium barbarum]
MIMMENLLLMSVPELSMKDIKKYYGKNHSLRLILINVKHITKLLGEQGREEYMSLGSEAQSYYGPNLSVNSGFNASASAPPSTSQSAPTENMEELVMRLIPTLTERLLPLFIEKARGVISSPSHHPNTPIENPSVVTPIVPSTTAANVDDVDPLVSDDDRSPSPMH